MYRTVIKTISGAEPVIKKPVFFQVDFVQKMRQMPSRLAERMDQKLEEQKSSHVSFNELELKFKFNLNFLIVCTV